MTRPDGALNDLHLQYGYVHVHAWFWVLEHSYIIIPVLLLALVYSWSKCLSEHAHHARFLPCAARAVYKQVRNVAEISLQNQSAHIRTYITLPIQSSESCRHTQTTQSRSCVWTLRARFERNSSGEAYMVLRTNFFICSDCDL
jgi:hypothetical protein